MLYLLYSINLVYAIAEVKGTWSLIFTNNSCFLGVYISSCGAFRTLVILEYMQYEVIKCIMGLLLMTEAPMLLSFVSVFDCVVEAKCHEYLLSP